MSSAVISILNNKKTLYVGGLDEAVTEDICTMAFVPFGELSQVIMPTEPGNNQKHRGFAFIEFESAEDAEHALFNMNNAELYGKVLKISYAKPQALAKNKAIWQVEEELAGTTELDDTNQDAQS